MNQTIFVLGDSVAAPRTDEELPMAGWGQKIKDLVVGPIEVANYARSAMTSRKYFTERFPAMLNRMRRGDVVLIGFGTVDRVIQDGTRYVPVPEYKELLRLFARHIHEEGEYRSWSPPAPATRSPPPARCSTPWGSTRAPCRRSPPNSAYR